MAITIPSTKWIFTCDRCGNTVEFYHGMTTWSLDYDGKKDPSDKKSFCSEICAREIYLQEKASK